MKTQLAATKKEGKPKGKGKRKDARSACGSNNNIDFPQGSDELTAEELVMTATGCKVQISNDYILIHEHTMYPGKLLRVHLTPSPA